jgi:hypothetical protein
MTFESANDSPVHVGGLISFCKIQEYPINIPVNPTKSYKKSHPSATEAVFEFLPLPMNFPSPQRLLSAFGRQPLRPGPNTGKINGNHGDIDSTDSMDNHTDII